MRLDQLQLDLRPRPHWQASDLGFSLLRLSAGTVYTAWLALWLTLIALCFGASLLVPDSMGNGWLWCLAFAWWLRPLLERVVVLVLSRSVFGERMSWIAAVRAWPRELGGGWFRLLTWWRPIMAGRGLYQAVWQLEGARGKFARERRGVLARDGAGAAAYWFGIACLVFEIVLQFGVIALIGVILSRPEQINPFMLFKNDSLSDHLLAKVTSFGCYAFAVGIIAPIYTAGCFTLYMNRRANLEAWDIELVLKQIKSPTERKHGASVGSALTMILACALISLHGAPVKAANQAEKCDPPVARLFHPDNTKRGNAHDSTQAALRQRVETIYNSPELRDYECNQRRVLKDLPKPDDPKTKPFDPSWFVHLADIVKYTIIGLAITLLAWLLYRFRDHIVDFVRPNRRSRLPDAVVGMDIRPESLPDDVITSVRKLWADKRHRDALALLYRATLSRLAHAHKVALPKGATEGDCLRAAERASLQNALGGEVLQSVRTVTHLWLTIAYAHQLPDDASMEAACTSWQHNLAGGA